MDKSTLQKVILRWARRDYFNGWGRIFLDEFTKAYGVSEQEVMETKETDSEFHVSGNVIIIKISKRGIKETT